MTDKEYLKVLKYRLKLYNHTDNINLSILIHRILNDKEIISIRSGGAFVAVRINAPDTTPTGRLRSLYNDFVIHGKTESDNDILERMMYKIKNKSMIFGDCLIDCGDITFIFVEPKYDEWKKDSVKVMAGRIYNGIRSSDK